MSLHHGQVPSLPHYLLAGALLAGQLRGEEAAVRGARLPSCERHDECGQRLLHRHRHRDWALCHRKVGNFCKEFFQIVGLLQNHYE